MNPRYPRLPDSFVAEVRASAAKSFTKLSASTFVRIHLGFGMPEKMSSSTSQRAGIDLLPPVAFLTSALAVGVGVFAGRRATIHASKKKKQVTQHNSEMRWYADILARLGHERCPIVLVEIAAKISVPATTNVVRRVPSALILVDGMPAIVSVLGGCTAGLVPPPPIWSASY